jgi:hypothetical protein
MSNSIVTRQLPRSDALDALTVKERNARKRLATHFIAFVRAPQRASMPYGWIFYASSNPALTCRTDQLAAFMVGNPPSQVYESRDLIQTFHRLTVDQLDERDASAPVIIAELREYQGLLLQDKDEPRANAVEFLFIDNQERVCWCDWAGNVGSMMLKGSGQPVLIRGCYDIAIRRKVQEVLRRRCCRIRPSKATLTAAIRDLKRITRLSHVGCVPLLRK